MTPEEKRRRFRDLAKHAPVKTARQLEAEQAQPELDFTPARRKPAHRSKQRHSSRHSP
jgi:hypothetical protein